MRSATRRCLAFAALVAAVSALTTHVNAQSYPNRPVCIVVPFAAGGAVDTVGRIVAAKMSDHLGQPVIVENRTGAGGNIGADTVAKSPPDGYTLLLTTSGHAITPALYRTVPYDAVKDFTPVSQVLATTFVLVASPKLPVTSIADVIALAKSKFPIDGFLKDLSAVNSLEKLKALSEDKLGGFIERLIGKGIGELTESELGQIVTRLNKILVGQGDYQARHRQDFKSSLRNFD